VAGDLRSPKNDLVRLLTGFDLVISSIIAAVLLDQAPFADVKKKARVGRFIPCFFGLVTFPTGVMKLHGTVMLLIPYPLQKIKHAHSGIVTVTSDNVEGRCSQPYQEDIPPLYCHRCRMVVPAELA